MRPIINRISLKVFNIYLIYPKIVPSKETPNQQVLWRGFQNCLLCRKKIPITLKKIKDVDHIKINNLKSFTSSFTKIFVSFFTTKKLNNIFIFPWSFAHHWIRAKNQLYHLTTAMIFISEIRAFGFKVLLWFALISSYIVSSWFWCKRLNQLTYLISTDVEFDRIR